MGPIAHIPEDPIFYSCEPSLPTTSSKSPRSVHDDGQDLLQPRTIYSGVNPEVVGKAFASKSVVLPSHIVGEPKPHVDYRELFDVLDIDSAGYITIAKLCHIMAILGMQTADGLLDEMLSIFDEDGDGHLTFPEFNKVLNEFGFSSIESEAVEHFQSCGNSGEANIEENHATALRRRLASKEICTSFQTFEQNKNIDIINLDQTSPDVREVLKLFDFHNDSMVHTCHIKRAVELLKAERTAPPQPEDNPFLHWSKGREKRGLGGLVYKANHIALTVQDVGRSAAFYTNVLGFEPIRRPNFDRYGAWFTMGNIELHLIKGDPVVPTGDNLIVGHISIETNDIDQVPHVLKTLGVPFQQNVSVPKAADAGRGTNVSNTSDRIVKQYFVRDLDGYYIEICNCDVLSSYCLPKYEDYANLNNFGRTENSSLKGLLRNWAHAAGQNIKKREQLSNKIQTPPGSVPALAGLLGFNFAEKDFDKVKLRNLLIRRTIYGDICQNETEESLKEVLRHSGNNVPRASYLMKMKALLQGTRKLRPPPFYENGTTKTIPPLTCKTVEL